MESACSREEFVCSRGELIFPAGNMAAATPITRKHAAKSVLSAQPVKSANTPPDLAGIAARAAFTTHPDEGTALNVLPESRLAQIEWFEQRLAAWLGNTEAIGLTNAQVMQLQSEIAAARVSYNNSQQARADSKSATVTFYANTDVMSDDGRDLIKTIKAYAETTGDPNVYALANVPPPAEPTPAGPPDTPTNVTGVINSDGAVELKWNGTLASRTFFESIGAKSFLDATVPFGTTSVQYRVRAKRGEFTSPANDPITIRLGVEPQTGQGGLSIAA